MYHINSASGACVQQKIIFSIAHFMIESLICTAVMVIRNLQLNKMSCETADCDHLACIYVYTLKQMICIVNYSLFLLSYET